MIYPSPFFRANNFRKPIGPSPYSRNIFTPSNNRLNYPNIYPQMPYSPNNSSKSQFQNKSENITCNLDNTASNIDDSISNNYSDECFEFLGLKLHFDDLLIIVLLFFLYKEDVKDTYLYIALILLLLS